VLFSVLRRFEHASWSGDGQQMADSQAGAQPQQGHQQETLAADTASTVFN
jgi:hypothetical protein